MFIRGLIAFTCLTLAVGRPVSATSIGINFATDGDGATFDLPPSDFAGVLPQQHWNNAHNTDPTLTNLVNDQGEITAASITWPHSPLSTNVSGGSPTGNLLHSAIRSGPPSGGIVVSNIPYEKFDLYLYMAAPVSIYTVYKINIGPSAEEQLLVRGFADASGMPSYKLASDTQEGNYLFLAGVTGSTLYISPSFNAPVGGLQIVGVPEPTTLALVAIGSLALLAINRRRNGAAGR